MALGWAFSLAGCSAPPILPFVLLAPDVTVAEALSPGSALGPGESDQDRTAAPIAVRCRLLYLREPQTKGLQDPGVGAAIVADVNGSTPILETPELTLSTLYAVGDEAKRWLGTLDEDDSTTALVLADRTVFVPENASFQLSMRGFEQLEDPRDWLDEFEDRGPVPKEVGVIVTNEGSQPRVAALVTAVDPAKERQLFEDYLASPNVLATTPGPAQDEQVRQEVLELTPAPSHGAPLVLHLDSPFTDGNGTSISMVIEQISPEDVEDTTGQAAVAALASTAEALEEQRQPLTTESRAAIERSEALRVFQERGGRSALLQVAQESKATLALELALVADESFLVTLNRRAFPHSPEPTGDAPATKVRPEPAIGWRLDRAAWELLAEGALNETLEPELQGVLFRAAGALAAFPDLLQEAAKGAKGDPAQFQDRLIAEQRYFLEDSSASARLRAYDWLKERGIVVPGYDPLGERDARRAALAAEAEAAEALENAPEAPTEEKR